MDKALTYKLNRKKLYYSVIMSEYYCGYFQGLTELKRLKKNNIPQLTVDKVFVN